MQPTATLIRAPHARRRPVAVERCDTCRLPSHVDNGKSLPLWRDLPALAYWIVPTAIGIPIILFAIARHANALERATGSRA